MAAVSPASSVLAASSSSSKRAAAGRSVSTGAAASDYLARPPAASQSSDAGDNSPARPLPVSFHAAGPPDIAEASTSSSATVASSAAGGSTAASACNAAAGSSTARKSTVPAASATGGIDPVSAADETPIPPTRSREAEPVPTAPAETPEEAPAAVIAARQGAGGGERAGAGERRGGDRRDAETVPGNPRVAAAARTAEDARQQQQLRGGGGTTAIPFLGDAGAVLSAFPRLPAVTGLVCLINLFFCLTLLCLYMLLEDYGESNLHWQRLTAGGVAAHTAAEALLHGAASVFQSDAPPKLVPSVLFVSNPLSSHELAPPLYYRPPYSAAAPTTHARASGGAAALPSRTDGAAPAAATGDTASRRKGTFSDAAGGRAAAAADIAFNQGSDGHALPTPRSGNSSADNAARRGRGRRFGGQQSKRHATESAAAGRDRSRDAGAAEDSRQQAHSTLAGTAVTAEGEQRGGEVIAAAEEAWGNSQKPSFNLSFEEQRMLPLRSSKFSSNTKGSQSTATAGGAGTPGVKEGEHTSSGSESSWLLWMPSFSLSWLFQRAEELPLSHAILRRVDSLGLQALRLQQEQQQREWQENRGEDAEPLMSDAETENLQLQQEEAYAAEFQRLKDQQHLVVEEDAARLLDFTLSHVTLSSLLSNYAKSNLSATSSPSYDGSDSGKKKTDASMDNSESDTGGSTALHHRQHYGDWDARTAAGRQTQRQQEARSSSLDATGAALLAELGRYFYVANPGAFPSACARRGLHHSVQLLRCGRGSNVWTCNSSSTCSSSAGAGNSRNSSSSAGGPACASTDNISGVALERPSVPALLRNPRSAAVAAAEKGEEGRGVDGSELQSSSASVESLLREQHQQLCLDLPSVLGDSSLVRRLLLRAAGPAALPSFAAINWDHVMQLLSLYHLREMPMSPPPHTLQQKLLLPPPLPCTQRQAQHQGLQQTQEEEAGGQSQQRQQQAEEEEEEEGDKSTDSTQLLSNGEGVVVETVIDERANYLYVFVLYRRDRVHTPPAAAAAAGEPEPSVLWVQHSAAPSLATAPPGTGPSCAASVGERKPLQPVGGDARSSAGKSTAGGARDKLARRDEGGEAQDEGGEAQGDGGAGAAAGAAGEGIRYRTRLAIYRRSLMDIVQAALVGKLSRASLLQWIERLLGHATQKEQPRLQRQQRQRSSSSLWQWLYGGDLRGASSSSMFGPAWLFGSGRAGTVDQQQQQFATFPRRMDAAATEKVNASAAATLLEAMRIGSEPPLDSFGELSLAPVLQQLLQRQEAGRQLLQPNAEELLPQREQQDIPAAQGHHRQQELLKTPQEQQQQRQWREQTFDASAAALRGERNYGESFSASIRQGWARRWRTVQKQLAAAAFSTRFRIGRHVRPGSLFDFAAPLPLSAGLANPAYAEDVTQPVRLQQPYYDAQRQQQQERVAEWRREKKKTGSGGAKRSSRDLAQNRTMYEGFSAPSSSLYYVDTSSVSAAVKAPYDTQVVAAVKWKQQQMPSLWEARAAVRLSALQALDGLDRMAVAAALTAGCCSADEAPQQHQQHVLRELHKEQRADGVSLEQSTHKPERPGQTEGGKQQQPEENEKGKQQPQWVIRGERRQAAHPARGQRLGQSLAVPFRLAEEAVEYSLLQHSCRVQSEPLSSTAVPDAAIVVGAAAGGFGTAAAAGGRPAVDHRVAEAEQQHRRCKVADVSFIDFRKSYIQGASCEADTGNPGLSHFSPPAQQQQQLKEASTQVVNTATSRCGSLSSLPGPAATPVSAESCLPIAPNSGASPAAGDDSSVATLVTDPTAAVDAEEEIRRGSQSGGETASAAATGVGEAVAGTAAWWLRPQLYFPDSLYLVLEHRRAARDAYTALLERRGSLLIGTVQLPVAVACAGGQVLLSYAEFLYLLLTETGRYSSSLFSILKACMRHPRGCYRRLQQNNRPLPKHPWLNLLPLYNSLHAYYSAEQQALKDVLQQPRRRKHQDNTRALLQLVTEPLPQQPQQQDARNVDRSKTPFMPWALMQLGVSLAVDAAVVMWHQQHLFIEKTFGILFGTETNLEEKLFHSPTSVVAPDSSSSGRLLSNGVERFSAAAGAEFCGLKINFTRALVISQRTFERAATAAAAAVAGLAKAVAEEKEEDGALFFNSNSAVFDGATGSYEAAAKEAAATARKEAARRDIETHVWDAHIETYEQERHQREEHEQRIEAEERSLPWTRVRHAESRFSSTAPADEEDPHEAEENWSVEQGADDNSLDIAEEEEAETRAERAPTAAAKAGGAPADSPVAAEAEGGGAAAAAARGGRQRSAWRHVLGADGGVSAAEVARHPGDQQHAFYSTPSRRSAAALVRRRRADATPGVRSAHAGAAPFTNAWAELSALGRGVVQHAAESRVAAPVVFLTWMLQKLLRAGRQHEEAADSGGGDVAGTAGETEQRSSEEQHNKSSASFASGSDDTYNSRPEGRSSSEGDAAILRRWDAQNTKEASSSATKAAEQDRPQQGEKGGQVDPFAEERAASLTSPQAAQNVSPKTGAATRETAATATMPALLWALTEGVSAAALGSALRGFQLVRSYAIEGDQAWLAVDRSSVSAAVVYSQQINLDTQWRVTFFPRVDRTADRLLSQRRAQLYRCIVDQQVEELQQQHSRPGTFQQSQQTRKSNRERENDAGVPRTQPLGVHRPHSAEGAPQQSVQHVKDSAAPPLESRIRTPREMHGDDAWQAFFAKRNSPEFLQGIPLPLRVSGGYPLQELTAAASTALTLTIGTPPFGEEDADGEDDGSEAQTNELLAASAATWDAPDSREEQWQQQRGGKQEPSAALREDVLDASDKARSGRSRNRNSSTIYNGRHLSEREGAPEEARYEGGNEQEDSAAAVPEYELLTLKFEGNAAVETGALSSQGLIFRRAQDNYIFRQSLPLSALLRYHQLQVQRQQLQHQQRQQQDFQQELLRQPLAREKPLSRENHTRGSTSSKRRRRTSGAAEEAAAIPLMPDFVGPRMAAIKKKKQVSSQQQDEKLSGDVLLLQTIKSRSPAATGTAAPAVNASAFVKPPAASSRRRINEELLPPVAETTIALLVDSGYSVIKFDLLEMQRVWVPRSSYLCPSRIRNSSRRLATFLQPQKRVEKQKKKQQQQQSMLKRDQNKRASRVNQGTEVDEEGKEKEKEEEEEEGEEKCLGWIVRGRPEVQQEVRVFQPAKDAAVDSSAAAFTDAGGRRGSGTRDGEGMSAKGESSSWRGGDGESSDSAAVGVFDFMRDPLWGVSVEQRSFVVGYLLTLRLYHHHDPPVAASSAATAAAAPLGSGKVAAADNTGAHFSSYVVADAFPEYWKYAPAFRLLAISDDGRCVAGVSGALNLFLQLQPRGGKSIPAAAAARAGAKRRRTAARESTTGSWEEQEAFGRSVSTRQQLQELLAGALSMEELRLPFGGAAAAAASRRPFIREIDVAAALQEAGIDVRPPRRIVSVSFFPMNRYLPILDYHFISGSSSPEKKTENPLYLMLLLDDGRLLLLLVDPNGAVLPPYTPYNFNTFFYSFSWPNIVILLYILLMVLFHLRGHQLLLTGGATFGGTTAAAPAGGGGAAAAATAAAQATSVLLRLIRACLVCTRVLTSVLLFPVVSVMLACIRALRLLTSGFRPTANVRHFFPPPDLPPPRAAAQTPFARRNAGVGDAGAGAAGAAAAAPDPSAGFSAAAAAAAAGAVAYHQSARQRAPLRPTAASRRFSAVAAAAASTSETAAVGLRGTTDISNSSTDNSRSSSNHSSSTSNNFVVAPERRQRGTGDGGAFSAQESGVYAADIGAPVTPAETPSAAVEEALEVSPSTQADSAVVAESGMEGIWEVRGSLKKEELGSQGKEKTAKKENNIDAQGSADSSTFRTTNSKTPSAEPHAHAGQQPEVTFNSSRGKGAVDTRSSKQGPGLGEIAVTTSAEKLTARETAPTATGKEMETGEDKDGAATAEGKADEAQELAMTEPSDIDVRRALFLQAALRRRQVPPFAGAPGD